MVAELYINICIFLNKALNNNNLDIYFIEHQIKAIIKFCDITGIIYIHFLSFFYQLYYF